MRWSLIKLTLLVVLEVSTWRYIGSPGPSFFLFWACIGGVLTVLAALAGIKTNERFKRDPEASVIRQDLLPHRDSAPAKRTLPPCLFYVVLNLALYLLMRG